MSKEHYSSVVELVLEILHDQQGRIDVDRLTETLRLHFPRVEWNESYWHWYLEQCTEGRFKHLFSPTERDHLVTAQQELSPKDQGVEINLSSLAPIRKTAMAALRFEDAMVGTRKLNVTSHIGQMLACYHLKLRLNVDPHQRDYCALDAEHQRVQIKTRRLVVPLPTKEDTRLGRLPQADTDYTILVQLDHRYRLLDIWQADTEQLLSHHRPVPGYLHLQDFMAVARQIWPLSITAETSPPITEQEPFQAEKEPSTTSNPTPDETPEASVLTASSATI